MIRQSTLSKKLLLASLIVGSTLFSWVLAQRPSKAESFNLVWSTEFNTSLHSWDWNIYKNAPFASSQTACFMGANTYTQGGVLNLVINSNKKRGCNGRPYASGGLDTHTYRAQTYGRWEVRAKMPSGYGVVGYIGLFPVDGSWPPEIDFAEHIGKQPQSLFLTQHYGTWPNTQQDGVSITETSQLRSRTQVQSPVASRKLQCTSGSKIKPPSKQRKSVSSVGLIDQCGTKVQNIKTGRSARNRILPLRPTRLKAGKVGSTASYWSNDYHTYTLEWIPGELRYYIDGVLQVTQPQRFTETPAMMKLAIGTGTGNCGVDSWMGCPQEATTNGQVQPLPAKMQVDSVKIYQYVP
jgi:hypothetical protein